ncbi:hypothetical protein GCM10022419_064650 [Nonomuraea rosea]|uniref:Uncharacterized protein n=1 Tax=Nonomuraea rosea TaxID=638574 RepID=A0ABP6Y0P1_9ACTN
MDAAVQDERVLDAAGAVGPLPADLHGHVPAVRLSLPGTRCTSRSACISADFNGSRVPSAVSSTLIRTAPAPIRTLPSPQRSEKATCLAGTSSPLLEVCSPVRRSRNHADSTAR